MIWMMLLVANLAQHIHWKHQAEAESDQLC
jgi:hypothetical protein